MLSSTREAQQRDGVDDELMTVCPDRAALQDRLRVVVHAPREVRDRLERTPAGTLMEALQQAATDWSRRVRAHLELR